MGRGAARSVAGVSSETLRFGHCIQLRTAPLLLLPTLPSYLVRPKRTFITSASSALRCCSAECDSFRATSSCCCRSSAPSARDSAAAAAACAAASCCRCSAATTSCESKEATDLLGCLRSPALAACRGGAMEQGRQQQNAQHPTDSHPAWPAPAAGAHSPAAAPSCRPPCPG